jgi:hypothetical protein
MIYGNKLRGTGQTWFTDWTPEKVATAPDPTLAFAEYVQQTMGVPWPTNNDIVVLRKKVNEFFSHYPNADFYTLCRVAGWCRARRKRFQRVWMVVDCFRDAFAAGALPELDRRDHHDADVEAGIAAALQTETDPWWRRRFLGCQGPQLRREALADWRQARAGGT